MSPQAKTGAVEPGRYPGPGWTDALLDLIADLVRRPRWTDSPLPLIWLADEKLAATVLDVLAQQLARPVRSRVPHCRLDDAAQGEIRQELDALCWMLSRPAFGGDRLQFKHYDLATWLMDQDLSNRRPNDIPGELTHRLQKRHRPHRQDHSNSDDLELSAGSLPGQGSQLLSWVIRRVPHVFFRIAISGRVPGIGRRYRWFIRRQPNLAASRSITFLDFAERLTVRRREDEPPGQIDKLLIHAFLEDLRRAYARPPWRLRGWRHTAYTTALIDNVVQGNTRHSLLRLINDVRNETGQWDPLLLICAGERTHNHPDIAAARLKDEHRSWDEAQPRTRRERARRNGDWIWRIGIPGGTAVEREDRRDYTADFEPNKTPVYARRTVVGAACLALVLLSTPFVNSWTGGSDCRHMPFDDNVSVREIDHQCIGYSSNGFKFNDQPGQKKLVDIQERIFAQNRTARKIWEDGKKRRPYVTVVYLGTLTGRVTKSDEEAYVAEREELEGMAVAQYDAIDTAASQYGAPLLNIVIANGGFQMEHAGEAVAMIADLARRDRTVLGVIGLVESRKNIEVALQKLNEAGLPAIAPTLSADGIYRNSNLYLQIAPPNRDEATLVGRYAQTMLHTSGVHIHYTAGEQAELEDDLYVETLLSDLKEEFGRRIKRDMKFGPGVDLSNECGYSGMLFYAGRWSEFDSFLQDLATSCGNNPPKHLVADDSVNRYIANPAILKGAPGNIPLTYVSKAALAACDQLRRRSGEEAPGRFLRRIQAPNLLTPARCAPGSQEPVGERVGLAYDSTMMMLRAVRELGGRLRRDTGQKWNPDSITPVAIYTEILRQNREKPFPGVTGDITFDAHGEPVHKPISLLEVKSIPKMAPPIAVFQCGAVKGGDPPTCLRP
jgi:hypothetical protein